jgi:hypothetical protein
MKAALDALTRFWNSGTRAHSRSRTLEKAEAYDAPNFSTGRLCLGMFVSVRG